MCYDYQDKFQNITGMMIYYYFLCTKKLWYFMNELSMEQNSELVSIGKILDETSYEREKKNVLIDGTINVDFIDNGMVLHEVKKTKAIEEAGIWQIKYYMYYLDSKGVNNITAEIDYPLLREKKEVFLEEEDRNTIDNAIQNIREIIKSEKPPMINQDRKCKKCSYFDLCYV
ncbi:MAG: CRISPR-associated protein Cas4 [Clostridia bacterium]|nr:CRISPR-associated protein Cas4 [Clostridia bacterium]